MTTATIGTNVSIIGGSRRQDRPIGFVAATIVLGLTALALSWTVWASQSRTASSQAQGRLNGALAELLYTVTTAQSSMRGFVLTGTDAFLDPYRQAFEAFPSALDAVTQTLAAARVDGEEVEVVSDLAQQQMTFIQSAAEARAQTGFEAASALVASGVGREIMAELRSATRELTAGSNAVIENNMRVGQMLGWTQLALLLPALGAAGYLARLARQRQEQVRAGADLLTDVMEAAPVGVAFFDADRHLRRANDEFAGVVSATGTVTAKDWLLPVLDRVLATRTSLNETGFVFGDAGERRAVVSAFPTRGADRLKGGVGVFVLETTEQQRTMAALDEASAQLAAIGDNIPQLAWMAEPTGRIVWHNRRWFDYTGSDADSMARDGWSNVIEPEHTERVDAGYRSAVATGEPWEDTFPLRAADGTYRWFLTQAVPIRNGDGQVVRWFGTNTDVTKQRALEEEFLAAKEVAENANRAKSQFIANMSHELRTPLSAVIGYAEMLEEEVEDLGQTHLLPDLKKIEGNARHLLSLINDVLDLSKIEAERMDLYAETFDLATVLDEVGSTVGSLIGKKSNRLLIEHDGRLGQMHSDQVKLRQCLLNLLSNASKFTESGTITLAAERSTVGDRDWITLSVTDSGIGMTPEQVERLFERFAQADETTTRKFGGTGLGLAITRAFCRLLGGDIGVTSQEGVGTTFTIRIPAIVEETIDETAIPTGGDTAVAGASGTVLAIDDDPHARDLVTRFLTKEGFTVRTASDGVAGLEMARALVPDVILLDVTMPKKDGWSVLAELKEDPRLSAVPVVMVSSLDEKRIGYALGASDYLVKPVEWDRLKEIMDRYRDAPGGLVLAIDDDEDTLSRYAMMLQRQGFEFASATNGRLGLQRVEERRPDLILLDLNMPVMDGFDFLTELRADPSRTDIPVVVLSSKDLSADERQTLNAAADQVLSKTEVSLRQLAERIREVLPAGSVPSQDAPPLDTGVSLIHRPTSPTK
ncbi:response regulator [Aureimonas sp. AU4]|uniref:response regulator n=1 Tax=Aureimonas sp. AU4 TaxID=1638163 RepID=UPI00078256A4|nr:response regulator [Aureimonas sp. AU4]